MYCQPLSFTSQCARQTGARKKYTGCFKASPAEGRFVGSGLSKDVMKSLAVCLMSKKVRQEKLGRTKGRNILPVSLMEVNFGLRCFFNQRLNVVRAERRITTEEYICNHSG